MGPHTNFKVTMMEKVALGCNQVQGARVANGAQAQIDGLGAKLGNGEIRRIKIFRFPAAS